MIEEFSITIVHNKGTQEFGIKPFLDNDSKTILNEVWQDGKHYFTICPYFDDEKMVAWKDQATPSIIDNALVEKIGDAIENHDD
jgi:hypothetical protein